ncbi:hypothetical protein ANN_12346 [Periplaneta americana]|uniref:Katanin p80 WD40 repeat-containing subunit B1 n=1 Tax=Periplaneta americana TaxID=6978 RepID=A0ABQ8TGZ5_PERAM|nr:hypothetical protein ANN_12346 [Periplaneta americana]
MFYVLQSLSGHTTPVECVQFGHTEELVCAGSQTGALKIWDLEAAKIVRTLTGHKATIRCMDFHPYGDFLTSGSLDTSIKVCGSKIVNMSLLCTVVAKKTGSTLVANFRALFTPEHYRLLWDIRRKGCIFTYKGHKMTVNSLKFSPDGQWIASAGEEGLVKLWDIRAGRLLKEFPDHGGPVTAVEFHPNEFLLASSSSDRTVNFWDLENFQLVSTTDRDCGAIRCIYFSPGGECLYAGSMDVLKVYGWEPARTYDTIPMGWGKVQDIATAQNQLIGASFHMANVVLYVVDLKRVQPFGGDPDDSSPSPFVHGQSIRKSFSREKPFNVAKATTDQLMNILRDFRLDVKTIEESDRSGTDPEDEMQSVADIPNVGDYQAIFQPNRKLNRTPPPDPFPAPLEDDPSVPQLMQPPLSDADGPASSHSLNSLEFRETLFRQLPSTVPARTPPSPPAEPVTDEPSPQYTGSPRAKSVRKLSSCRDPPPSFPEVDFPVRLSNIRHSPSEPALNRPNSSHTRSHSLSRNLVSLNPELRSPPTTAAQAPVSNKPTTAKSTAPKAVSVSTSTPQSYPMEISISPVPSVGKDDKEEDDFVPMSADKPSGLDMEDFLPRSYSKTFGYQQTFPNMSEAEVLSSMMRGHESMMTVLSSRQRSLQIIYSLWHNKDLKVQILFLLC